MKKLGSVTLSLVIYLLKNIVCLHILLDDSADKRACKVGNTQQGAVADSISPAKEESEGVSYKQAALLYNWMISETHMSKC